MNNMTEFYSSILHNVREEAKKEERERIIRQLDVLATQEPDYAQVLIHNLKVLIKGENK